MNNNKMNKTFNDVRKKTGIDAEKMKQAAENGRLDDYLSQSLSGDTAKKLNDILSDKSKLQELLSTDEAKELMNKLSQSK